MRVLRLALPLLAGGLAFAQTTRVQELTTSTFDFEGRPVQGPQYVVTKTNGVVDEAMLLPSPSTRLAPRERIEERIVRDDASGRVVEQIRWSYDADGRPLPPEKTRIEETRRNGASTIVTTTWVGDVNQRFELRERATTERVVTEGKERATTTVERPTANARLQVVEKQELTGTRSEAESRQEVVIYQKDVSGNFTPARRLVTETQGQGERVREVTTEYEAASTGRMQFASRTESDIERAPDGSERRQVAVYGVVVPGGVADPNRPQLREQQLIERQAAANRGYVETFSIRRPAPSEPHRLGEFTRISETVCQGECIAPQN